MTGVVGLGVCAVVVGLELADDLTVTSVRVAIGAAEAAVLLWAYLLRPRVILEAGGAALVLRNPLSSWRIPLDSVRTVVVRTVTTVKTDDARYDAVAVGYPLRTLVRELRGGGRGPEDAPRIPRHDEQAVMTDAILAAADSARRLGVSGPPASRSYAVVEIGLFAVAALAFASTYLV